MGWTVERPGSLYTIKERLKISLFLFLQSQGAWSSLNLNASACLGCTLCNLFRVQFQISVYPYISRSINTFIQRIQLYLQDLKEAQCRTSILYSHRVKVFKTVLTMFIQEGFLKEPHADIFVLILLPRLLFHNLSFKIGTGGKNTVLGALHFQNKNYTYISEISNCWDL